MTRPQVLFEALRLLRRMEPSFFFRLSTTFAQAHSVDTGILDRMSAPQVPICDKHWVPMNDAIVELAYRSGAYEETHTRPSRTCTVEGCGRRFNEKWGYFEFLEGYIDETKRNRKRCATLSCDAFGVVMGIVDRRDEMIYWHCFQCGIGDVVPQVAA